MHILVTMPIGEVRDTFIPQEIVRKLESLGDVVWNETVNQFTKEELREKLMQADVCLSGWGCPAFDEQVLAGNDKLRLIAHTGGSVGVIMSPYLFERGVRIISGNYLYAESVAESALAYMLCSLRNIPFYCNEMQAGRWKPSGWESEGLFEQSIGLVGFGLIAKVLVGMLKPFRNQILVYDPHLSDEEFELYEEQGVKRASLSDIFSTCKIVSLHAALSEETQKMVDKKLLRMIPEGSILINTARGKLLDERALEEELQSGRFKAFLDVYEEEPLPSHSKLRGLPNAELMPHMGGPTVDRRKYVTAALIRDIEQFRINEPLQHEIKAEYAMQMTKKI